MNEFKEVIQMHTLRTILFSSPYLTISMQILQHKKLEYSTLQGAELPSHFYNFLFMNDLNGVNTPTPTK